jgi:hypothetical protein
MSQNERDRHNFRSAAVKGVLTLFVMAAALHAGAAWAHGDDKARHGGQIQMAGETKFELVAKGDTVELYLDDHGQTMPTAKLTGKLTVLSGSAKSEAKLEPASGDKLVAKGVKLAKGDKVIALVTLEDKSTASARFVIK